MCWLFRSSRNLDRRHSPFSGRSSVKSDGHADGIFISSGYQLSQLAHISQFVASVTAIFKQADEMLALVGIAPLLAQRVLIDRQFGEVPSGRRVSICGPEKSPAPMMSSKPPTSISVMTPAKVTDWTVARQTMRPMSNTTPIIRRGQGRGKNTERYPAADADRSGRYRGRYDNQQPDRQSQPILLETGINICLFTRSDWHPRT